MGDIIGGLFGKEGKSKSSSTSSSESGNSNLGLINQSFGPVMGYTSQAGNLVNSLLGIGPQTGTPAPASGTVTPAIGGGAPAPFRLPNGSVMDNTNDVGIQPTGRDVVGGGLLARLFPGAYGDNGGGGGGGVGTPYPGTPAPGNPAPGATPGADGLSPQQSALENFSNSAGMGFLRDQGMKAINANQSAKGLFNSGSTGTALEKFGQGLASTFLDKFLQNAIEQERIGLGAGGLVSSAGQYSNSTGESSGKSNAGKHGLIPDILVAAASAGGGGGGG